MWLWIDICESDLGSVETLRFQHIANHYYQRGPCLTPRRDAPALCDVAVLPSVELSLQRDATAAGPEVLRAVAQKVR